MSIAEEHARPRDAIKVRSSDDVVDASSTVHFSIKTGIASPVVGKEKENVRPPGFFSGNSSSEGEYRTDHQGQYAGNQRTLLKAFMHEHVVLPHG